MPSFFIPKKWRWERLILFLMILEFPLTVVDLTLFGVAAPNTYRTKLWKEGGLHGFNSDPTTILYAYANYRPVNIPMIWSSYHTQFNLVISVLTMFLYLVKFTMFITHVFYPLVSLVLHLLLVGLWSYSVRLQTGPDTIDPERINNGAPWYITKNCDVASTKENKQYCMQAKSAFAITLIMLIMFAIHAIAAAWSLWPTKEQRIAHQTKVAEKKAEKEKWAALEDDSMSPEQQWQHMWELQQLPRTPGTAGGLKSPMTPTTRAFNALDGSNGGYYHQANVQTPITPGFEFRGKEAVG